MKGAGEFAGFLDIVPTPGWSGGQGLGPHDGNPYHATLVGMGFAYSHSTPVGTMGTTGGRGRTCPDYYAHLTYRHPALVDFAVGIDCRPGWKISAGRGGSGRRWVGLGAGSLARYLKSKLRESGHGRVVPADRQAGSVPAVRGGL